MQSQAQTLRRAPRTHSDFLKLHYKENLGSFWMRKQQEHQKSSESFNFSDFIEREATRRESPQIQRSQNSTFKQKKASEFNSFRSSETGNNVEKRDDLVSQQMNELKQEFQKVGDLLKCIVTSRHRKSFAGPQPKEIDIKQREFRTSKSVQQLEERTLLFDQEPRGKRQRESNYAIYLKESANVEEEEAQKVVENERTRYTKCSPPLKSRPSLDAPNLLSPPEAQRFPSPPRIGHYEHNYQNYDNTPEPFPFLNDEEGSESPQNSWRRAMHTLQLHLSDEERISPTNKSHRSTGGWFRE